MDTGWLGLSKEPPPLPIAALLQRKSLSSSPYGGAETCSSTSGAQRINLGGGGRDLLRG